MLLLSTATVLILWLSLVLFFDPDGFGSARPCPLVPSDRRCLPSSTNGDLANMNEGDRDDD